MADQNLADVISIVESSGLHYAAKFEPHLYFTWIGLGNPAQRQIVAAIQHDNGNCDTDTAKMIACTSWGYYQLLGENIWTRPRFVTLSDYLADIDGIQETLYDKFLTQKGINFTLKDILQNADLMTKFVTAYNGLGDVANYEAKIRQVAATKFPAHMTMVQS